MHYKTRSKKLQSCNLLLKSFTSVVRILSEFQICIGWGKGELQENVEKDALFYKGTHKLQKIMNTALLSQCKDFSP